jgi:hypothetical protein
VKDARSPHVRERGPSWSDDALLRRMRRAWGGGIPEDTPYGNRTLTSPPYALIRPIFCRLKNAIRVVPCCAAALVILSALGTSLAVAEQAYIEKPYLIDGLLQLDPVGKTPEPMAPEGKPWSMPQDYPAPRLVPAPADVGCLKVWGHRCVWQRINHAYRVPKSENA